MKKLKKSLKSKVLLLLILVIILEGRNFQTKIYDSSYQRDIIETEKLNASDPEKEHYVLNWTKEVDIIFHSVATDSEGNVYFVGEGSSWNYYLLKYSSNGTLIWSRNRGIIDVDQAMAVVIDSEDNVYISGWCVVGSTEGGGHVVTLKYNKTGDLEWQQIFGSENRIYDMTIDDDDNIYISGHTEEFGASYTNKDMLILKYSSEGTLLWYRRSQLSGNDFGYGIEYNSLNSMVFVTGSHAGNVILFMYDKNGNLIDSTYWDNGGSEIGKDISINQNTGNIYVTGATGFSYVVFNSMGINIQNVTGSSQEAITVDNLGRIFVSKEVSHQIVVNKFFNDGRKIWEFTLDYWDYPKRMAHSIDRSVYIVSYYGRLIKLQIDDINPKVNITSPTPLESFGTIRPDIAVEIDDPNLNETWYFLSNSSISSPNLNWEGEISQNIWEFFDDGNISINICANDSNNNFGFDTIDVVKNTSIVYHWNLTNNIFIDDADPNNNWDTVEKSYPWCYGSGTFLNPYVIENVFIDGKNSGSCLYIRNSNSYFIIKNCNFTNSGSGYDDAGIRLRFAFNGTIVTNNCSNNGEHGIFLQYSSNNSIINNCVMNNRGDDGGIYVKQCDYNYISGNTLKFNHINGINLENSLNIIISENNISDNNYHGIELDASSNNKVLNNIIINNGQLGINVDTSRNNTISNNEINMNNIGIKLDYHGQFNNVSFNFMCENNVGILLDKEEDNTLYFNKIINCSQNGIYLQYSDRNDIVGNIVEYSGENGIVLITNSDHNNILNNNICHNTEYGIYNENLDNSLIGNNVSFNSESGIFTVRTTEFHDNNVSYNLKNGLLLAQNTENFQVNNNFFCFNLWNGISTEGNCNYNTYFNNTLNWNSFYGIDLGSSDHNQITNNYLVGNQWGCINIDNGIGNVIDNNYCDDIFEENDDFASASLIIADSYENLRINDPDWYYIHIEADMTISLTLFISPSSETIDIFLYNSDNELIHSNMALTNSSTYKYTTNSSQYYYICLMNAECSYSMEIEINPKSDENNNGNNDDTPPPAIPGYDIFFLLGVISLISTVLIRKKFES